MEINDILVIAMFGSFMLFLFLGYPVAWVLGGVAILFTIVGYYSDEYLDTVTGLDYNTLGLAVGRVFGIMDNWVLVALPMFIFMGLMLDKSGVAERMMHSMQRLFGNVKGGLAITVMLIGIILAASTGIIGASVVLLGLMSLPVMLNQNYDKSIALGTVASAGCLGILIPPSIMLVIMGDQLALSVGDLFMGAVFPGILLGTLYIVFIFVYGLIKPNKMPIAKEDADLKMDFALAWDLFKNIIPPAALVLTVLGSIFFGLATPTEASGLGAFGALVLTAMNGKLKFNVLKKICHNTMNTTGYIFAIFVGATCFSLVLRELGGDELISSAVTGISDNPIIIVAFILFIVFLLGFVLDWIEITLIVLPLVAPIVQELDLNIISYGIDNGNLIWFVLLVAVTLQTSFLTPPVGFALFYLKGVCPPEIALKDIYKGVIPFILLQLLGLALIAFFPQLVTWLPSIAY